MYLETYKEKNNETGIETDVIIDYILSLNSLSEQVKLIAVLEKIDEGGAKYLVRNHEFTTKKIEADLFEIKISKNRFLYCYRKNNIVHIVHAFTKKTQKTPITDKVLARNRIKRIS